MPGGGIIAPSEQCMMPAEAEGDNVWWHDNVIDAPMFIANCMGSINEVEIVRAPASVDGLSWRA